MNLDELKKLAKQTWDDGDHEGHANDYYYYEYGFIAGMSQGYILRKKRLEALQKLTELDEELGLT